MTVAFLASAVRKLRASHVIRSAATRRNVRAKEKAKEKVGRAPDGDAATDRPKKGTRVEALEVR